MANMAVSGWGLTVLRVVVGVVFLAHGVEKFFITGVDGIGGFFGQLGIPLPGVSALLVSFFELVGGAALILGLYTRLAAVPLAIISLVAMLTVHLGNGFFNQQGGVEYTLTLFAACVALILSGAGAAALKRVAVPTREAKDTTSSSDWQQV